MEAALQKLNFVF